MTIADLRELGRLKGERADVDPEVGAVDLGPDSRQARGEKQQQPDDGDRVPIALEHVVVAQEVDRQREQHQTEDEPVRLVAGEVFVDPVDHHQAERGQQGGEREQVRVGVGQPQAQVDVGREADGEEVGAVDQAEVAEFRVLLGEDRGEAGGEQEGDGNEGDELPVACGDHITRLCCPWLLGFRAASDGVGLGVVSFLRPLRGFDVFDQRDGVFA